MQTDKQFYEIFAANPKWLFELSKLPWPGPCRFVSIEVKAIARRTDGVIVPEDTSLGLTVIEFQLQKDQEEAPNYYNQIRSSGLPSKTVETLSNIFIDWIEQRFSQKGKKEIEDMMIGALPDLRETQSGRELIQIGRIEGKAEGKAEGLLLLLDSKFGPLDSELRGRITKLDAIDRIDRLFLQALRANSIDELTW
jgi:predicted transposase YdaD